MDLHEIFIHNWPVKLVSVILIVAAYIDGKELRVPNWITFPMVISGLAANAWMFGWEGFASGLIGMCVGLLTLLPLYSVGGMGAGDVKLMAGIGAWLGGWVTIYAFVVSSILGGVMAIVMAVASGKLRKHYENFFLIMFEFKQVKNPRELSQIAAERKSSMLLLPYGIPICIGSIGYFFYAGMI